MNRYFVEKADQFQFDAVAILPPKWNRNLYSLIIAGLRSVKRNVSDYSQNKSKRFVH